MKHLFSLILLISISLTSQAQYFPFWGPWSQTEAAWGYQIEGSGTNCFLMFADTMTMNWYHDATSFQHLDENHLQTGPDDTFVMADEDGFLTAVAKEDIAIPWEIITGEPSFSTFTGDYDDLTDKPTIPTNTNQLTNGSGFLTSFSEVDGSTTNEIEVASQTGNSGKYLTTNGTTTSWSEVKQPVIYSGTTNGSGTYTVTFGTAYSTAPYVMPSIPNQSNINEYARTTSVSTTGFTVNVYSFNAVLGVLQLGTSNVSSRSLDVLVIEK